jgi:hypothetical protein
VDAAREHRRARLFDAWFSADTRDRIGRVRDDLLRKAGKPGPGA